ncbi:MAG: helix-turn-helix domain-containing protein, partial [Frankia sp.]
MADETNAPVYTARGRVGGENWAAVAEALNRRMARLRIGQADLAARSGVSVSTLRTVQHGITGRRVQNRTLIAIARALDWPDDHLVRLLVAEVPATLPKETAGSGHETIVSRL